MFRNNYPGRNIGFTSFEIKLFINILYYNIYYNIYYIKNINK